MIAKQLLVFALCAIAVQGLEIDEKAKGYLRECQALHQIKPDEIIKSLKTRKLPESENGKCFMECVMEKFGVLKDGKFDADRAREIAAAKLKEKPEVLEKANQVIEKCSTEVTNPGGACEFGLALAKCGMKHSKELGIPYPTIGS